ncbi:MAG: PAS domain S-box protein, partial [Nitrospirota bacterium]|nr:PAS domain S-box protein [Nitrospirota bacterium]
FRNFRYAFRDPDGRQFIAAISGRPIFDEQGAFRGYRGTGTDITGQVVAERQAIEQQNLLADAIEALSHGFALFDDQDRRVVCNRTYRAMHGADEAWPTPGIPYETLVRRTIERGTLPDAVGSEAEWIRHLLQFHRVADGTAREHRLVDGRWIATSKCRLANGWVATIRVDITELKQREAALKESEERFRALAEATSEGIIVHDGDKILDANRAFVDLLGYSYEDLLERDVLDLVSPEGRAAVAERIQAGSVEPYELMARRSDGTQFPAEVRAQTVAYQRRPVRVVALRDLSERKRAEEHIHHLAHHDALTGLPNRFLFLDRLRQAMAQARRDGQPIAVLQLDLDHFKDVNDTLGHHAGDDLLRQTARRLRDCVYDTDTVARLGGD